MQIYHPYKTLDTNPLKNKLPLILRGEKGKDQMDNQWLINYENTRQTVGYKDIKDCTPDDYQALGFRCGLEVHQQLLTDKKLFCRCPAGVYHHFSEYDAEIIRHMRPTLSELGEYDGTALMEFKTKKEIVYRINNRTACTYEMDDTPPFAINRQALAHALRIAHLMQMKIVGEVHITRKQYLDGSIPTGFQRTGILGIEGQIYLKNKTIKLIQFSVEEDSCREVSDIGHRRIYFTDRLGMPLIETVTYPEMLTPQEAEEACQNIRFIARSTGLVRVGIGAGREDVNVSITGGTRVEIKGVSHIKWIPNLTHNEGYRQKSLLCIKDELNKRTQPNGWKVTFKELSTSVGTPFMVSESALSDAYRTKIIAVNLPYCKNILSYFTQPTRTFADEISDRLKVIACIEKPNMLSSEYVPFETDHPIIAEMQEKMDWSAIQNLLNADPEHDAQLIFWTSPEDLQTAIDTINERILLAFAGVPNETRKSRPDGTNIFERVLPGPDRMYPDTDSKPISLSQDFIDATEKDLPVTLSERYKQLQEWGVPHDCYTFLLRNNLLPLVEQIAEEFGHPHKAVAVFLGHYIKHLCGKYCSSDFRMHNHDFHKIYELYKFLHDQHLDVSIIYQISKQMYHAPVAPFDSILASFGYVKIDENVIYSKITDLSTQYDNLTRKSTARCAKFNWIMGKLHHLAVGNIDIPTLGNKVRQTVGCASGCPKHNPVGDEPARPATSNRKGV